MLACLFGVFGLAASFLKTRISDFSWNISSWLKSKVYGQYDVRCREWVSQVGIKGAWEGNGCPDAECPLTSCLHFLSNRKTNWLWNMSMLLSSAGIELYDIFLSSDGHHVRLESHSAINCCSGDWQHYKLDPDDSSLRRPCALSGRRVKKLSITSRNTL